jgi:SAM-dependent methyltransferase
VSESTRHGFVRPILDWKFSREPEWLTKARSSLLPCQESHGRRALLWSHDLRSLPRRSALHSYYRDALSDARYDADRVNMVNENIDKAVVRGFGDEWTRFDQSRLSDTELAELFDNYFLIFPFEHLPEKAEGFDLGCGSGRFAKLLAPRVGHLHCIDASEEALVSAGRLLAGVPNCTIHHASVHSIPLADDSMDFGCSIGVLHHVPDTAAALRCAVRKLKRGAPMLVYLYYALDSRPGWYRALWQATRPAQWLISRLPRPLRYASSQIIAATVYWPLARLALFAERAGFAAQRLPLASYRSLSFYTMRTDALDRFGTRLEQRFTRAEIEKMMLEAGLENIRFSEQMPRWTAVGVRVT